MQKRTFTVLVILVTAAALVGLNEFDMARLPGPVCLHLLDGVLLPGAICSTPIQVLNVQF